MSPLRAKFHLGCENRHFVAASSNLYGSSSTKRSGYGDMDDMLLNLMIRWTRLGWGGVDRVY